MNAAMPHIMLVAGEPSGDALGGELMAALKDMTGGRVRFSGVGGAHDGRRNCVDFPDDGHLRNGAARSFRGCPRSSNAFARR